MEKTLLEKKYGLHIVNIKRLREGVDNNVYLIETDAYQQYVLRESKRTSLLQHNDDLLFETTAISFLHSRGIPVASVIPTKDTSTFFKHDSTFYVLFEYKPGISPQCSKDFSSAVPEAACYLAQIHNLTPPPHLPKRSRTVFTELERVMACKKTVEEKIEGGVGYVQEVEEVLNRATAYSNNTGFVHNDYRSGNILVNDGRVSAILDFDWICIGPCAKDIGLAIVEWSFPDNKTVPDQSIIKKFILHYNKNARHPADKATLQFWVSFACLSETATYLIDMLESSVYKKVQGSFMYQKYQYFNTHPELLL